MTIVDNIHVEHGPVLSRDGHNLNVPRISGECLITLSNNRYEAIAENALFLAELKQLMRHVINFHLGHKKLKSREMFKPLG